MKAPVATYRLQFNASFRFTDAKDLMEYLAQLGVSHVYASPIFKAQSGSTHGYDVVEPNMLNPELGSKEDFEDLMEKLEKHGIGWMQDIVPNHMAYSKENSMLADILELGVNSRYFKFFDVNWNHHSEDLQGKLLAPFLGRRYAECLRDGEIRLIYDDGFNISYLDNMLPIKMESYREILMLKIDLLKERPAENDPSVLQFKHAIEGIEKSSSQGSTASERAYMAKETVKKLYLENDFMRDSINASITEYNLNRELLDNLIAAQNFKLCRWKAALEEINYRRFFSISDLICLRVEEMDLFEEIHRLVLRLVAEGRLSGLRIDHIDGLHDPKQYLERLRERASDVYMVAEKILMPGELLPETWPIHGTTGYDFLNCVNGVFIAKPDEAKFNAVYSEFTGYTEGYDDLLHKCKMLVLQRHFAGDVDNLTWLFKRVLSRKSYGRDCTFHGIRKAMMELLATFPVYRTYLSEESWEERDVQYFRQALLIAKQRNHDVVFELEAIEKLLEEGKFSKDALQCFMRLQQYTGSIMAKGLEDTALYVFNRLIPLNEVGGNASVFGISVEAFHEFNRMRLSRWPSSMNATSTHDTKRGEDLRARLNVLSEIPSEWKSKVLRWAELNLEKKRRVNSRLVPDRNEEYYIYQTLVGAFPFNSGELLEFTERVKTHMVKAVKEAKVNSSWLEPDTEYEQAITSFVGDVLNQSEQNNFLKDFIPFQRKIAFYGLFNSLSQTLLKITSPGVPDFYQGGELWDLNLVDPDNRRAVDFRKRKQLLKEVLQTEGELKRLVELLRKFEDGRIKLYVINKSLRARRGKRELFEEGEYIPLAVEGTYKEHIIAFCRRRDREWAVTVVSRLLTGLINVGEHPLDNNIWRDTYICLPRNAPNSWEDVFTRQGLRSTRLRRKNVLQVGEALKSFPVALLLNRE